MSSTPASMDFQALRKQLAEASALLKQAFQPMPGDQPPPMPAGAPPMPAPPPGAPPVPPMDPAAMAQMAPPAPPPMAPAAAAGAGADPAAAAGVDPTVLMELLRGLEQVSQLVQSLSGKQEQLEERLLQLYDAHAKTAAQLDFMIKMLKEQPAPPAMGEPVAAGGAPVAAPPL